MQSLHARELLKRNIDDLLRRRGYSRHDLAHWCKRDDSWLSKIFKPGDEDHPGQSRQLPLKYLDKIADFFGVDTYQLFVPGIADSSERRRGGDRRAGNERRQGPIAVLEKPADAPLMDHLNILRVLERPRRDRVIDQTKDEMREQLNEQQHRRSIEAARVARSRTPETAAAVPAPARAQPRARKR